MMWQFNIWHLSMCPTKQKCEARVPAILLHAYDSVIFLAAKYLVKNNSNVLFPRRCKGAVASTGVNPEALG